MGNSRAGDCGRLTLLRGHCAARVSNIIRLPFGASASGEVAMRADMFNVIIERPRVVAPGKRHLGWKDAAR